MTSSRSSEGALHIWDTTHNRHRHRLRKASAAHRRNSADVPRHDLSATIPPAMILNDIRRNDALPTIFLDDPATTLAPHH